MKTAILQSNYIPWRGYFDMIKSVDFFVLYDHVQYTKNDWRNRNIIKTNQGQQWLTIPVQSNSLLQSIDNTFISEKHKNWYIKHLRTLQMSYAKSKYFKEVFPWIEHLYNKAVEMDRLTDINEYLIREISSFLEIKTEIKRDSDFELIEGKNEKLLNICKQLGSEVYLSGPAAKSYIDEGLFKLNGIDVEWMDYSEYPEYEQINGDFMPNVSILDLIFNTGTEAKNYISKNI